MNKLIFEEDRSDSMLELTKKLDRSKVLSMMVIKDNKIIFKWLRKNQDDIKHICSCTKSFISALIGIAVGEGLIEDIDKSISEFFPKLITAEEEQKQNITIRNLLEMRSGFDWPEFPRLDSGIYMSGMRPCRDWVKYILSRPIKHAPGTVFNYSSGDSHLLSAILNIVTGSNAFDYAKEKLFKPLDIKEVTWYDNRGVYEGGTMLKIKTNDMLKFGYLYLNEGDWFGKKLIPSSWVVESTTQHSEGHPYAGVYGYQWWVNPHIEGEPDYYFAFGYGGQFIIIVPELNMVASMNTAITRNKPDMMFARRMFKEYFIKRDWDHK